MGRKIDINEAKEPAPGRILIVGGGLAGSLLALALGRAGRDVVVFDQQPHSQAAWPGEALDGRQMALLRRLDALSCFEPSGEGPVDTLRAAWPANVRLVESPVLRIETCEWLQEVETVGGERVLGRLLVMATGVEAPVQAGMVTIGDAFGSGLTRMLNDVRLLSRTYIPRWLLTPGMHRRKVAAYYADSRKRRMDGVSRAAA